MQILYNLICMQIVVIVVSIAGRCECNFWPVKNRSTQPVLQQNCFVLILDSLREDMHVLKSATAQYCNMHNIQSSQTI